MFPASHRADRHRDSYRVAWNPIRSLKKRSGAPALGRTGNASCRTMEPLEPRLLLSGTFAGAVDYATGNWPNSVVSADFNADGKADLAIADARVDTVSILLGNGDGTFAAKIDYATRTGPQSVIVGDFNGDGKADLAVANGGDNVVSVLLGQGDGTFAAKVDYATGGGPYCVISADFNGDAEADLAVANAGGNTVSILLGNGDGTFATKVDYATGAGPHSVTSADLDADGKADLAVTNYNANTVSILLGTGNGTFAAKVDYATGSYPLSVISKDFNGDGKADLAVANAHSNTVSLLKGNGDGTFAAKVDYATGAGPYSVISADFNGDAKADLAVTNYNANTVRILLGNGDGTFVPEGDYATGRYPISLASADFNADGKADLAVANIYDNTVSVFLHTFVDSTPPSSSVVALPASTNSTSFTVTWSGSDATGSGIAGYDIFVSDNGSPFIPWKAATLDTSAIYVGQSGHTYQFYSIATDARGNREAVPALPEATTSVGASADSTPPSSSIVALPASTNFTSFTVTWSGSDASGSGIASYDVFVSDNGGAFTAWKTATLDTSATYVGQSGHTYQFYSVATDAQGNREADPAQPDATITAGSEVDSTAPSSSVLALPASTDIPTFAVTWSGSDDASGSGIASYDVFVSDNAGAFTAWKTATPGTSATYTGRPGHTYRFYSIATDIAGNRETPPAQPDAAIFVGPTESKTLQGKNNKWTFTDSDGTRVTITYSGAGQAVVKRWYDPTTLIHTGDLRTVTIDGSNLKSALTITTKGKGIAAQASVGDIIVHGSMMSITGKTTSLLGNVTVDGTLGSLTMDDATTGSAISIGPRPAGNTKTMTALTFDQVAEMSILSATPFKSLTVTQWLDNDGAADAISAPSIAALTVKGDPKRSLAGDFEADLNLQSQDAKGVSLGAFKAIGSVTGSTWTLAGGAGMITVGSSDATWTASFGDAGHWANVKKIVSLAGNLEGSFTANSIGAMSASANLAHLSLDLKQAPDTKLNALGALSTKGWIDSVRISANGTIRTVTAGGIRDSNIFAGVNAVRDVTGVGSVSDNVLDLPGTGDMTPPVGSLLAGIKALTVTGIKAGKTYVPSFINSSIAAGSLGKVRLSYVMSDNDGNPAAQDVPFGLTTATTSAFTLSYKDADKTHAYKWATVDGANLPSWFGDFALRLV